ncbi:response regulator transcription factor [candidate division KSB1 bacterium]|nr:response regulator transcription factor [candidate division KSB1 bacterium]
MKDGIEKKPKHKILLIEDDPNLGFILNENLELQGFKVKLCANGEEGLTAYHRDGFDLCLIDVMLPKKDGFTLAREIRKTNRDIPIIFLTAKSLKDDRIEGFKIGGDDYITKPFSMEELVLRIQAVLKRTKPAAEHKGKNIFAIGNYTFDYEQQNLQISGKPQKLTSKEAELLKLLCLHINDTLERELALKLVWGEASYFNGRSMDVFISKLRKYLQEDGNVEIMNVHGRGFKLVVR